MLSFVCFLHFVRFVCCTSSKWQDYLYICINISLKSFLWPTFRFVRDSWQWKVFFKWKGDSWKWKVFNWNCFYIFLISIVGKLLRLFFEFFFTRWGRVVLYVLSMDILRTTNKEVFSFLAIERISRKEYIEIHSHTNRHISISELKEISVFCMLALC